MNESEPTIRIPHSGKEIKHCKWLIRRYIECDAYVEYDWLGSPDPGDHDTLTCRQRDALNGLMHVWRGRTQARDDFWCRWLGQSLSDELRDIPLGLDLIDDSCSEVFPGISAVRRLVNRMAEVCGVGDVAPTKALHLLRPRFVAISDSRVRPLLGIPNMEFSGPSKGPAKGKWCAARALKVQRAIRDLGRNNKKALKELQTYVNQIAPGIVSSLLGEEVAASKPPVQLSKTRVLDIVLWAHAAWGDAD